MYVSLHSLMKICVEDLSNILELSKNLLKMFYIRKKQFPIIPLHFIIVGARDTN